MTQSKTYGYVSGIIASAAYGLNPLFAIPQYAQGMNAESVLFYRYSFAALMIALVMVIRKESFKLTFRQLCALVVMGTLFGVSSLGLFWAYNYIDSGIASTILFTYPIFVAVIMAALFHERISWMKRAALGLAFIGIALLYQGDGGVALSTIGVAFTLLSSITYAFYIIGVNKLGLSDLSSYKLTFYAMFFGIFSFVASMLLSGQPLMPLNTVSLWLNSIGIALFPTFIAMVFIAQSIRIIGETPAAILGALEPLTALCVSVTVLGGTITPHNMIGICLIVGAVLLTTIGKDLFKWIKTKDSLCKNGQSTIL